MTPNQNHPHLAEAIDVLSALQFPKAQLNERSALCLLALLNLTPNKSWNQAGDPLMGITPIMEWCREHYDKPYAPNTRERFRRQTMHQFVAAGIALYNPDEPGRPVNSPKAVYQIESTTLELLRSFGSRHWQSNLEKYLASRQTLTARYAKARSGNRIPVRVASGKEIELTPGKHSELLKAILEKFGPCFIPVGELIYVGDTGKKWGYFDEDKLKSLGVTVDAHGKMPDAVLYCPKRNWLLLIEAVTSHGPVDGKRHEELAALFSSCKAGLIYVTAFPNRTLMRRHLGEIAWETEVWVADSPTHLIHFNGERFLGPYEG